MATGIHTVESYLFSVEQNGRAYAVSVPADDYASARARFLAMTAAERRRFVVAPLEDADVDLISWAVERLRHIASLMARTV